MIRIFFSLLFITLSILPQEGFSAFPQTESDFRALPPFCKARASGGKSQAYQTWEKRLGHGFLHVHHYCSAMHTLRLYRTDNSYNKIEKARLLQAALGGINYVEENARPNFVLFPHIFVTKADIYLELKKEPEAIRYLKKAVKFNPKFILAYMRLFDVYYKLGEKSQALEVVKKGLEFKPKSKGLKRRLAKLE